MLASAAQAAKAQPAAADTTKRAVSGIRVGIGLEYRSFTLTPSWIYDSDFILPAVGADYQLGRRMLLGFRWAPRNVPGGFAFKSFAPLRASVHAAYQLPIRIQLGGAGFLLETTLEWHHWDLETKDEDSDFQGQGQSLGLSLGLVSRDSYHPRASGGWRLALGYAWGDDFRFEDDQGQLWERQGQPVHLNPEGLTLRLEAQF